MPATILVGTQWGDEGKGKATDLLGDRMDLVVRYQGGNNAGHTVQAGGHTLKLHLVPSAILSPGVTPVIADGVVVDPGLLLQEMDELQARGIATSRVLVSANAHLVMPYHLELDRVTERYLGRNRLGTTKRGIGPAYADKGARMQERGQEFGTTTGRRRRCGWFDAVVLRYAARVNGLTELFLTKLDVLSGLPSVKVCVAYRYGGEVFEDVPPHQSIVHRAEPVYEELEGWPEELSETRDFDELPPAARKYVERLADLGGGPVSTVSVGPSREQTVE